MPDVEPWSNDRNQGAGFLAFVLGHLPGGTRVELFALPVILARVLCQMLCSLRFSRNSSGAQAIQIGLTCDLARRVLNLLVQHERRFPDVARGFQGYAAVTLPFRIP